MCAELCNNVSRYDGVKNGYRTAEYKTIGELYTKSRSEAFGELLKTAILYGSESLSTDNYMKIYDKALRVRRVMAEKLSALLSECDALLLPACAKTAYAPAGASLTLAFEENAYTAPASITGMPAVIFGGVQLIGKPFSDASLLSLAKSYEKEGK
jgi:aspartyl-tRNA(Asn)/glutamyl-tRNA(Gln) amidotransferase subunit A